VVRLEQAASQHSGEQCTPKPGGSAHNWDVRGLSEDAGEQAGIAVNTPFGA